LGSLPGFGKAMTVSHSHLAAVMKVHLYTNSTVTRSIVGYLGE
jgi:hypothetical protein